MLFGGNAREPILRWNFDGLPDPTLRLVKDSKGCEEKAKKNAEEKVRKDVKEQARKKAEEKARKEKEEKAKKRAELDHGGMFEDPAEGRTDPGGKEGGKGPEMARPCTRELEGKTESGPEICK
uniref:Complexin-1 n=1 Tax=Globodera pallida TaxID=36090 RepID=A0A183BX11_GLOPA